MNEQVTRQQINGVHVLVYPHQSHYVPVAERVRVVHKVGIPFSFEKGEILHVHTVWIYRAWITVKGFQYMGDAEIFFHSPRETPDGTHPISCGQTSAIGNALEYAGFGDLPSVLERLGEPLADEEEGQGAAASSHQTIEGIRVVLVDQIPYVPVAERLRQLHLIATPFSIESAEVQQQQGCWFYRATISVAGKRYIGDAEIFFDAPAGTLDARYPVSCGQTSAIGNALAIAGFGDVASILERQGKGLPQGLTLDPTLASADAVLRARSMGGGALREASPIQGAAPTHARPALLSPSQREQIRVLCERLGTTEPADLSTMNEQEATQMIAQLTAQEQAFLQEMDALVEETEEQTAPVSYTDLEALKKAWMRATGIRGNASYLRQHWEAFKVEACQGVQDEEMTRPQYERLLATLGSSRGKMSTSRGARPTSKGVSRGS